MNLKPKTEGVFAREACNGFPISSITLKYLWIKMCKYKNPNAFTLIEKIIVMLI